MPEYTKINFNHRKNISDYADLVAMLFPGNRNQQHAATCILFELKWADHLLTNLGFIEQKYNISRRILQRSRAKLTKLGLIEHISSFNSKYGGQAGWKLSTKFKTALSRLADNCALFLHKNTNSKEKEEMFISYTNARRFAAQ